MNATKIEKFVKVKFGDLKFESLAGQGFPHESSVPPIQALIELPNGYTLSIVRHGGSYGNDTGLYEIGCFKDDKMVTPKDNGPNCWNDSVKGWLAESDVEREIEYIRNLRN